VAELDHRVEQHFSYHENPERSAKNILAQPSCNPYEPWRLSGPEMMPSDWARLGQLHGA